MSSYLQKIFLSVFCLLAGTTLLAQTMPIAPGELTALRKTTVSGEPAFAGLTFYNQAQIKTAVQGLAFINLGQHGHLELQADTEFTLLFSTHHIGGQLRQGQIILNAPANVAITVNLLDGQVVGDGKTAVALSVETNNEQTGIKSYQGEVKVLMGERIYPLASGEAIWFKQDAQPQRMASAQPQSAHAKLQPPVQAQTLINLIRTSIYSSVHHLIDSFRVPSFLFETTLTCRDKNNLRCHPNGDTAP